MAKDIGTVSKRAEKLMLTITAKTARDRFGEVVDLLNASKVDIVEVTNHGKAVCQITSCSPQPARLPVGKFEMK